MSYDRTNRGNLGKNTRRRNDRDPTHTGSLDVDGVAYWLNAWVETNGNTGEKFFSVVVKPKEQRDAQPQGRAPASPPPAARGSDSLDDDIPF